MENVEIGKTGKMTIENLTEGMYEDARIIFREYIQNSADQIDLSQRDEIFGSEKLKIDITIDSLNGDIEIFDNATGIKSEEVAELLGNIAYSSKIRGESKGFRGIGRLGGLAYCDTLCFTTTYLGEHIMTTMKWEAKKLRKLLADSSYKEEVAHLIQSVTSLTYTECDPMDHFFKVELLSIRNENSDLLDIKKVREYIAFNAPVRFESKFLYKSDIKEYIQEKGYKTNEYEISVNDETINKKYSTVLHEKNESGGKPKMYDEITGIEFQEFKNKEDEMLAWMWYGISRFERQIPYPTNQFAGIRLRQHNIQIGDEQTLRKFHKEARGYLYFVGEVHAVHPELTPNGRRDYFNESETRVELESALDVFFKETLSQVYRRASDVKLAHKAEEDLLKLEKEKQNKKFVNHQEQEDFVKKLESAQNKAEEGKRKLERINEKFSGNEVFEKVFSNIEKNHQQKIEKEKLIVKKEISPVMIPKKKEKDESKKSSSIFLVDELTQLNKKDRKLVSRIYAVIKSNLSPGQSTELIEKIQEDLKNGKKDSASRAEFQE